MTEHPPSAIGTVAQEAARLIEEMATMARRSSTRGDEAHSYAGGPAQEPPRPDEPYDARTVEDPEEVDEPSTGACSQCGLEREDTQTAATCRLCPLCRGIALLRSVQPETVDLLADLALAMAATLRDVAMRSRASDPASPDTTAPTGSPEHARAPVQDIPVDDESEG